MKAIATAQAIGPVTLTLVLAALIGCDKSAVTTFEVRGTIRTDVADSPAPQPTPDPQPNPQPQPLPTPTGYDLNTNAALLEAWNNKLDPLGTPDMARLGSFGQPGTWTITEPGFTRSNSCYRWSAALVAPVDGEYEFTAWVKSGGSIWFDGELVWAVDREEDALSATTGHAVAFKRTLTKGKLYPLKAHVGYQGLFYGLTLDWKRPDRDTAESVAAAFLHPPADWQARERDYVPPPPPAPVMTVPDAAYRSPDLDLTFPGPWSTPIDQDPVDPLSDAIIARMGTLRLHPVFGPGVGIPFEVVPEGSPKVRIQFDYAGESDPGPYPVPERPIVESGGGDGHWIGVDPAEKRLYELFLVRKEGGTWLSGSGAIFDLETGLRVSGVNPEWTSADAAGLPILPGLVRPDEIAAGKIEHALRISVPRTRKAYVAPATHWASTLTDADLPPMGCRLRLKADADLFALSPATRVIAVCCQRYGLFVADNGGPFLGLCGVPDARWNDAVLAELKRFTAQDFEVIAMGEIHQP